MTINVNDRLIFKNGETAIVKRIDIKNKSITTDKNIVYKFIDIITITHRKGKKLMSNKELLELRNLTA